MLTKKLTESINNYLKKNDYLSLLEKDLNALGLNLDSSKIEITLIDFNKLVKLINNIIKNGIKKQTYFVCFSESKFNETLWLNVLIIIMDLF